MTRRALSCAIRLACAASFLATISRPLVSRSRRCTIPGRSTPAIPPNRSPRASSALTSVPSAWPGAGWTHESGRLVDDEHVGVLVDDRQLDRMVGLELELDGRRDDEPQGGAGGDVLVGLQDPPIDREMATDDQLLDVRARESREIGDGPIRALRRATRRDDQVARLGGVSHRRHGLRRLPAAAQAPGAGPRRRAERSRG